MLINRTIFSYIKTSLEKEPKIIIIYGPRQSGKTTLVREILTVQHLPFLFFNGDDIRTQELLEKPNLDTLKKIVGTNKLLIIDEAQRIQNIGLTLKLIYDALTIHIIATGSSSLDLANKINEPLTGRTRTFTLYPISLGEIPILPPDSSYHNRFEEFLRFGLYPKVITLGSEVDKKDYLNELINTYLYKDILTFATVRKPKKIIDLLSLLALRIGSEVSIQELAQNLSLAKIVVEKYLDILEKMFVVINIRGFSRNLRKEISKTSKYYFFDIGLRNALIRNFNPLHLRNDAGMLWENFCVIERKKFLENSHHYANHYFWRTYDQKEIDIIEEQRGKLIAFEFKWSVKEKISFAAKREFTQTYLNSTYHLIYPNTLTKLIPENLSNYP